MCNKFFELVIRLSSSKMEVSYKVKQITFASANLLNMMALGMTFGYPAILTPALINGADGDLKADIDEAAWIASLSGLSGCVSAIAIGPMMHIFGRRFAHITTTSLILLGWILISVSTSLTMVAIGTAMQGLGQGLQYFYSICIAELTCPSIRGLILSLKLLSVSFGVAIIHGFGYLFHWKRTALVPVIPASLSILITLFSPNTPDWLILRGRYEEAEAVFFSLRGKGKKSENEVRLMIQAEKKNKLDFTARRSSLGEIWKKYFSKVFWRPVILLICALLIPEAGGRHYFPSYSIQLTQQITCDGETSNAFLYTITLDCVTLVCAFSSCFVQKRYSRRFLLITCGYIACFVLLLLCLILYIKDKFIQSELLKWTALALLVLYTFIMFISTFGVSYVLMGELLPLEYRSIGIAFNGIFGSLSLAFVLKILPIMQRHMGVHGMLVTFSVCMLLCFTYMSYELPETKERTLHDISEYFRGNSSKIKRKHEEHDDDNLKIGLNEARALTNAQIECQE